MNIKATKTDYEKKIRSYGYKKDYPFIHQHEKNHLFVLERFDIVC